MKKADKDLIKKIRGLEISTAMKDYALNYKEGDEEYNIKTLMMCIKILTDK